MSYISIEQNKLAPLATGMLKNGKPYIIAALSSGHAHHCKALHDSVYESLHKDEKSFFITKPQDFFENALHRDTKCAVIAVISENRIVAQAVTLILQGHNTGMADMAPISTPGEISVIQSVSVLPAYRGNGLMEVLTKQCLSHALAKDAHHSIAEVEIRNIASWASFLKCGFNIVSMGIDPVDGAPVYNLHEETGKALSKQLSPLFNKTAATKSYACPKDDLKQQQKLFKKGYVCVGYYKPAQTMVFVKDRAP